MMSVHFLFTFLNKINKFRRRGLYLSRCQICFVAGVQKYYIWTTFSNEIHFSLSSERVCYRVNRTENTLLCIPLPQQQQPHFFPFQFPLSGSIGCCLSTLVIILRAQR